MNIQTLNQTIKTLEGVRNAVGSFTRADVDLTLGLLRREVEAQATPPAAPVPDLSGLKPSTQEVIKEWLADGTFVERAIGAMQEQEQENMRLEKLVAAQPAPVQEPVAWMYEDMMGLVGVRVQKEKPIVARPVMPLYTTPPAAQRQWVGLTDENVYPLANEHLHYQAEGYEVSGVYRFARAIEAKLKEKNHAML